jgi:hypothetical protein
MNGTSPRLTAPDPTMPDSTVLEPWIDRLLAAEAPDLRACTLVGAVLEVGAAGAASLWRPLVAQPGGLRWRPVLERGPSCALPRPELVRAVLDGELDGDLGAGRRVVRVGGRRRGLALALGRCALHEDALDVAHALLAVAWSVDGGGGGGLLDGLQGPLGS